MKRFALILLVVCLCACTHAMAASTHLSDFLKSKYGKWTILSQSESGTVGAAILKKGNTTKLLMFTRHGGSWQVSLENDQAVYPSATVTLDTGELLILSNPYGHFDYSVDQFYFSLQHGNWLLTSAIHYENSPVQGSNNKEYSTWIDHGMLHTLWTLTDSEGNSLTQKPLASMPDVLTEDERDLSAFRRTDFGAPFSGTGYPTDEDMIYPARLLKRLFAMIVPSDYTYVDGIQQGGHLQFIADKAKGKRVLLCCSYGGSKAGWSITESTPLPAKTTFGIENFNTNLNLGGKGYGPRIIRRHNGSWGAEEVLSNQELFLLGPCWAGDGVLLQEHQATFGHTPWNDITTINWKDIPQTLKDARKKLDASGWATPNNPNPKDRLHLRAKPNKNSSSLGKYYNGTPVRVLEKGSTWTKVRIGEKVGYMMTKYLAFDKKAWDVYTAGPVLFGRNPVTTIYWDDAPAVPAQIVAYEVDTLVVIGTDGDTWYLVWDPMTDHFGKIRQSELWEGNG